MDVERVCELAKIRLNEEEKERIGKQFGDIVKWVSELNNVDTSNIPPFFLEVPSSNLREDLPLEFEGAKRIIENFPLREFDFVKVKKVIME